MRTAVGKTMKNAVDRKNRDALVTAINRYLDGESTAFQFDDEIFGITSDDPTVSHVVGVFWCFYDDCRDHKVRLSKDAWDYFQRLILVLQSDGHIEVSTRRRWDYTQFVAARGIAVVPLCRQLVGLGGYSYLPWRFPLARFRLPFPTGATVRNKDIGPDDHHSYAIFIALGVDSSTPKRIEL